MPINRSIIYLIFFNLFFFAKLNNYISIQIIKIDDCLRKITMNNDVLFELANEDVSRCDANRYDYYHVESYGLLIKNFEYNFKVDVEFIFEDYNHWDGWFDLNIFFNEYIIKTHDQTFWTCTDCGDNRDSNYFYNKNRINFYPNYGDKGYSEKLYHFYFAINDINDLYKGGANGSFAVNNTFYSLNSQEIFEQTMCDSQNALELINFNEPENFHITDNKSLPIEYTNYYFEVNYESVEGHLKGLRLDKTEDILHDLSEDYKFRVTDSNGLNYELSDREKGFGQAEVKIKITAYNYCPDGAEYQCSSQRVTEVTNFTFKIKVLDSTAPQCPSETYSQDSEKSSSKENTESQKSEESDSHKSSSIDKNNSDSYETQNSSQDNSEKSNTAEGNSSSSNKIDNSSSKTTEETNKEKTNVSEDDIHCLDLDNNIYNETNNDINSRICPNYHINQITHDINDIIEKIDKNKTYKIIGNDFVAQIIPFDFSNETEKDKNLTSTSYINFNECENILRNYYKIYPPRKLTFVQIQLNNTNDNILVNQIEYQVFSDENKELNLSLCKNLSIQVYYTMKNDTQDIIDLISTFKDKDIDILNINDNFYNDFCLPYSDSEKDLTLKDRIEQFYKDYQFCEKNCEVEEILSEENMISCNCKIKENSNISEFNFNSSESTINIESQNFKIIECYNAFTALKNNLNNIGFFIFLFLMILNIVLLILYCCSQKSISLYLSKTLRKYGYIGENDEGHAFCHNYIKKLDRLIEKLKLEKNKFIQKKGFAPPKKSNKSQKPIKKGKILNRTLKHSKNSKNNLLQKKIIKSRNNKKNLSIETEIERLKFRMNKTKKKLGSNSNKMSLFKSSKDVLIEDKKILKKAESNLNDVNIKEDNIFNLNLANINVNKLNQKKYIPNNSRHILNIYNFKEAIKYDKRSLCTIYYIFLISKQVIMHALFYNSPLEPLSIRLSLLKLILGCDLALNAIFYTDDKISERYNSSKSNIEFAFTKNITIIILSTLIGYIIFILIVILNNSTNEIRKLFRIEEEKIKNNKNYTISVLRKKEIICEVKNIIKKYKIKIIFFYIIEFSLMIFFWYYVTIFCYIYQKTQLSWLLDCLITILIRIFIDIFINFIFSLLYKCSIRFNIACLFKTIIFLYCFSC